LHRHNFSGNEVMPILAVIWGGAIGLESCGYDETEAKIQELLNTTNTTTNTTTNSAVD